MKIENSTQDDALPDGRASHSALHKSTGHKNTNQPTHLSIANRIAAALLGGYAFTWGFVALSMAALVALGVEFHEAENAAVLPAFIVFLLVFLWAFADRSLLRIWTVLAIGSAVMTATAWALQRSLLG